MTSKFEENINSYDLVHEEKEKDSKLKIWTKTVSLDNKKKVNVLKTEWLLPFSAKKYHEFINNMDEIKKMDEKLIDCYNVLEEGKEGKVFYARYKKILTASPRDFVYFKGFIERGKQNNFYPNNSPNKN